jgi:hypothetical protein
VDTLLLSGTTDEGETWTLHAEHTPRGPGVQLQLHGPEGRPRWGTGERSTPLPAGRVIGGACGTGDADEPATWLVKLHADVRAVVVHLSDGTREDLTVVDDPQRSGVRWAVLVHPRRLDVHRVDLHDARGNELADTVLP